MCNRNLIYLATCYTQGTDKLSKRAATKLKKERHKESNKVAAQMFTMGLACYSPITHGPLLEPYMPQEVADDWGLWLKHCLEILQHCAEVWVLCQPGWKESAGVKVEVSYAMDHKLPIKYCWLGEDGKLLVSMTPKED